MANLRNILSEKSRILNIYLQVFYEIHPRHIVHEDTCSQGLIKNAIVPFKEWERLMGLQKEVKFNFTLNNNCIKILKQKMAGWRVNRCIRCYFSYFLHFKCSHKTQGACMHAKSLKLCPTVYYPMDYSPEGSSVYGIIQARILEWVVVPSSKLTVLHSKFTFLALY